MKKGQKTGEAQRFFKEALAHTGDDCLIWPYSMTESGYPRLQFGKGWTVCRLICEKIHGPRAHRQTRETAHSCVEWKEGAASLHDICAGRRPKRTPPKNQNYSRNGFLAGERNPWAKLNAVQVHSIRTLYGMLGIPQHKIAKQFGLSQAHVGKIVNRQVWGHVA